MKAEDLGLMLTIKSKFIRICLGLAGQRADRGELASAPWRCWWWKQRAKRLGDWLRVKSKPRWGFTIWVTLVPLHPRRWSLFLATSKRGTQYMRKFSLRGFRLVFISMPHQSSLMIWIWNRSFGLGKSSIIHCWNLLILWPNQSKVNGEQ